MRVKWTLLLLALAGWSAVTLAVVGPPAAPAVRAEAYRLFLEAAESLNRGEVGRARGLYEEILALDPGAAEVHSRLARVCLRESDTVCAEDEARRALASNAATGEAHRVLAELALQRFQAGGGQGSEDLDAALEHLEQATEADPQDPWAWSVWIRVLALRGQIDEAESVARRAAATPGMDPSTPWLTLARVILAQGQTERAIAVLDRAGLQGGAAGPVLELLIDLEGSVGNLEGQERNLTRLLELRPDRAEIAHRLGNVRLAVGDPVGALEALERAMEVREADPVLRRDLAETLVRLGRAEEALETLGGIPAAHRTPRLHLLWSRAAEQSGDPAQAAAQLSELASRLGPAELENFGDALWLRMADLQLEAGEPAKALDALDRLDDEKDGLRPRIRALRALGKSRRADDLLRRLHAEQPEDPLPAALSVEVALEETGEQAAFARLDADLAGLPPAAASARASRTAQLLASWGHHPFAADVLERFPPPGEPSAEWLRVRGSVSFLAGRTVEAEAAFRALISRDPEDDGALNDLGYLLADSNRSLDEAIELCRRALALRPSEPAYLDSLGWALQRRGRHEEALGLLRESVRRAALRASPEMRLHLAEAYLASGDRKRALAEWRAARALGAEENEALRGLLRHLGERLKTQ